METETQTNSPANSEETQGTNPATAEGAEGGAGGQQATTTQTQETPKAISQEAYRALQSKADKTADELRKMRAEHERQLAQAREQSRQATLATLKPEEREAQIRNWRLEDRERDIAAREQDAEAAAKELTIARLALDGGLDEEARRELEAIDDVNEMRARAAELKAERLARELAEARKGGAATQQKPEGEQQRAPAGMRGDPAGSGQGGNRGTYDPSKFKGTGDIAGALRAKREAGEVRYERIPTRGR